jgi:hypothetical protein
MEFNAEHKVIPETMSVTEARAFISFLESERDRHLEDIITSDKLIENLQELGGDAETVLFRDAFCKFHESARERHLMDIEDIDVLIVKVKGLFRL